jgi:hypothetical protein
MFVFVPSFVSLQVSFLDFVRVVVPQAPAVFGEMVARWEEEGSGFGGKHTAVHVLPCHSCCQLDCSWFKVRNYRHAKMISYHFFVGFLPSPPVVIVPCRYLS